MSPKQKDPKDNNQKKENQIPLRPPKMHWSSFFGKGPTTPNGEKRKRPTRPIKNLLPGKSIRDLALEDLKSIAEKVDSSDPEEKDTAIMILKSKWSDIVNDYARRTSFSWACNLNVIVPTRDAVIEANKTEEAHLNMVERNFWDQILSDTTKQKISEHAKRELATMNDSDFVAWVNFFLSQ